MSEFFSGGELYALMTPSSATAESLPHPDAQELLLAELAAARQEIAHLAAENTALQTEVDRLERENTALLEEQELGDIDAATGALNRNGLNRVLKTRYGISHTDLTYSESVGEREPEEVLVMVGDVCDLKLVNDTLGHETGDAMLRETVTMIKELLGEDNDSIVARIGGDEFMVLTTIPKGLTPEASDRFKKEQVQRFKEAFSQKRTIPSQRKEGQVIKPVMAIGASWGPLVSYPVYMNLPPDEPGVPYHKLLTDADSHMYEYKAWLQAEKIAIGREALNKTSESNGKHTLIFRGDKEMSGLRMRIQGLARERRRRYDLGQKASAWVTATATQAKNGRFEYAL